MKYIVPILLIVIASSCNVRQWCASRYPPQVGIDTVTVVKDTVITEIRDTTIYIKIPGEIQVDSVPYPVHVPEMPELDLSDFIVRGETNFARAEAWLTQSADMTLHMHLRLEQKEMEIEQKFEGVIREMNYWKEKYTEITRREVSEVVVDTVWTRTYRWWSWISWAFLLGYLFTRLRPRL